MKKVFFIAYLVISVFSLPAQGTQNGQRVQECSFVLKKYIPCISVPIGNGQTLNVLVDTGVARAIIFDSGVHKVLGKNFVFPPVEKGQLRTVTYPALHIENITVLPGDFVYLPSADKYSADEHIDGLVGIDFFLPCTTLGIDYKNSKIVLNAEFSVEHEQEFTKYEKCNFYATKITVNGISQNAVIDTGAECFILRKDFDVPIVQISDEDLYSRFKNEVVQETEPAKLRCHIKFFSVDDDFDCYYMSDSRISVNNATKITGTYFSFIGYPAFAGRLIQFDFANRRFGISDL